jgi:hypothetical protein
MEVWDYAASIVAVRSIGVRTIGIRTVPVIGVTIISIVVISWIVTAPIIPRTIPAKAKAKTPVSAVPSASIATPAMPMIVAAEITVVATSGNSA